MEHLVQFGVSFDDTQLRKRLEENAYDDICNRIMDETIRHLPNVNGWPKDSPKNSDQVNWKRLVDDQIRNFISEYKDEIIDRTAEKLVVSYSRSKAYKEKMSDATDKIKGIEKNQ